MPGYHLRSVADHDLAHIAPHHHHPVTVGHWHRVVVGPVPHQGQGADAALSSTPSSTTLRGPAWGGKCPGPLLPCLESDESNGLVGFPEACQLGLLAHRSSVSRNRATARCVRFLSPSLKLDSISHCESSWYSAASPTASANADTTTVEVWPLAVAHENENVRYEPNEDPPSLLVPVPCVFDKYKK